MAVSDHTGQAWLQGFHDVGLAVFNMSADDLMEIKVRPSKNSTTRIFSTILVRTMNPQSTRRSCPSRVTRLSTSLAALNSTHIKTNQGYDMESQGSFL